jgi:putative glutamine amidotransferase
VTKPLVAVVGYHLPLGRVSRWDSGAFALPDSYVDALRRSGIEPAVLPPSDRPAAGLLRRFDGLVMAGGGDVIPARYGASVRHERVYGEDAGRDETEIALAIEAAEASIPTLAICRGAQVVNVAFGGTLHQHLADVDGMAEHRPTGDATYLLHEVKVADGSRLGEACGQAVLTAASHHHQGIDRLGAGLVPVGWSVEDGLVEAVELDHGWMVAVQWHPEVTDSQDPAQRSLFDAFGDRVRGRAAG